jgi:hypothetical protein
VRSRESGVANHAGPLAAEQCKTLRYWR